MSLNTVSPETPLALIIRQLATTAPLSLSQYMELCLGHAQHGFYRQPQPFGAGGHFITAPEICQIFGEVWGLWAATFYLEKCPVRLNVLELGPGRGTLMGDFLRGTQHVPGFHDALHIMYVDINRYQQKPQKDQAAPFVGARIRWAASIGDALAQLPPGPTLVLGNEYLDCLPVDQAVFHDGQWRERRIGIRPTSGDISQPFGVDPMLTDPRSTDLAFVYGDIISPAMLFEISGKAVPGQPHENQIHEYATALSSTASQIGDHLSRHGGRVLFCDYGYENAPGLSTVQAIYKHQKVPVFYKPGAADVTALVNFTAVSQAFLRFQCRVKLMTQHHFLQSYGFEQRRDQLAAHLCHHAMNATAANKDFQERAERVYNGMSNFYAWEGDFGDGVSA